MAIKDRYNLLFWILIGCTVVTVIVTLMMMYRMSQKPGALPTPPAPPPPPSVQQPLQPVRTATMAAAPLSGPVEERFANSAQGGGGAIVYIYSETCGWCDRFNPIWKDFADRYPGPLQLTKIEAKDPASSRYDVSGYPTVLAVKGDAVVATFDADRTVENLMKFASKLEIQSM